MHYTVSHFRALLGAWPTHIFGAVQPRPSQRMINPPQTPMNKNGCLEQIEGP